MKTLKKALSVILGLAIMLSCVMGMQVSVAAEGTNLELAVGEATVDGTTVTVPINVVTNPGFAQLAVEVDYDENVLELVSGVKNKAFSDSVDAGAFGPTTANPFRMMWAFWGVDGTEANGNANITATDTIATLTFNVLDDTVGTTNIDITVTEAWDVNGDDVTATAIDGDVDFVKEPECEHEWEYVTATPAEGSGSGDAFANYTTTKPGSITLKCDSCGEELTEEVIYYGRPKCFTSNALYESAITLTFSARKDRMLKLGQYDEAFVRFEHILPDNTVKETSQKVADGADTVKNSQPSKTFEYPVKAMQLTEEIVTNVFIHVDGVWYSGESFGYSVRSYADEILPYTTVSESEKKLVVNMLRYGSKMQVFKNYNIENLADADLPAEYAALITETDPTIAGTPSYDSSTNDCLQILGTSFQLIMDSRTEVKLRVRSDRYTAEKAKDDFVIEATWESAKGANSSAKFYNVAYANDGDLTYTQDSQSANAGRWEFYFGECPAYDFRQVITFKLYDAEDNIDVSNKFSASFEQLVSYGITNNIFVGNELAMYKAMFNYSDAARAHFCK